MRMDYWGGTCQELEDGPLGGNFPEGRNTGWNQENPSFPRPHWLVGYMQSPIPVLITLLNHMCYYLKPFTKLSIWLQRVFLLWCAMGVGRGHLFIFMTLIQVASFSVHSSLIFSPPLFPHPLSPQNKTFRETMRLGNELKPKIATGLFTKPRGRGDCGKVRS